MDESMNVGMIVEFLVTTVGVIGIIAVLSILTPWMAKHVDAWIARYKDHHSPKRNSIYSVRSIYDIPPDEVEAAKKAEMEQTSEDQ